MNSLINNIIDVYKTNGMANSYSSSIKNTNKIYKNIKKQYKIERKKEKKIKKFNNILNMLDIETDDYNYIYNNELHKLLAVIILTLIMFIVIFL